MEKVSINLNSDECIDKAKDSTTANCDVMPIPCNENSAKKRDTIANKRDALFNDFFHFVMFGKRK